MRLTVSTADGRRARLEVILEDDSAGPIYSARHPLLGALTALVTDEEGNEYLSYRTRDCWFLTLA